MLRIRCESRGASNLCNLPLCWHRMNQRELTEMLPRIARRRVEIPTGVTQQEKERRRVDSRKHSMSYGVNNRRRESLTLE